MREPVIIFSWPPNATDEDRKRKNVATTYKGDIYLPNGPVREDCIVHEKKHIEQYGDDYDGWLERCETDNDFYILQETEAYRVQILFIKNSMGEEKAKQATISFAKFLSSETYGSVITFEEALNKLTLCLK
jgi:hypothetical protein